MGPVTISDAEEEAERLPLRENFMRNLTALLKDREMSLRELAEGMGWSSHTRVQPWQRLRTEPKPYEVFALERFLKLPPGTLSRYLGYLPLDAQPSTLEPVEDAIDADPMLPDWGKRLLKGSYAEIKNSYSGQRRRRR